MTKKELANEIKNLKYQIAQSEDFDEKLELEKKRADLIDELYKRVKEEREKSPTFTAKELLSKRPPVLEFYKTGIRAVDQNLKGLIKGGFIQVAAASGAGKTTILRELIIECIKEKKYLLFLRYYNLHLSILYNHINNLNSEILVSNSLESNKNGNRIKQNEWKADIKKQQEKIEKNEKKLYAEANKYKIESKVTQIFLTFMLKRILKRNRKKIKKYKI